MWQNKEVITMAVVDDHPMILEGVQRVFEPVPQVVIAGAFTCGADFLAFLKSHSVQVALLDIALPDMSGVELCLKVKQMAPDTCVLAFSNHQERTVVMQMLQNGASGYLLKNTGPEEFVRCVQEALQGQVTFSAEIKTIMARPAPQDLKRIPPLTRREKQVLQLVTEGKTNPQIAEELSLSILTVETHRRNLMQKLEVKNAAALVKTAAEYRLL